MPMITRLRPSFGLEEELFVVDEDFNPVTIPEACWAKFSDLMPVTACGEYKASVLELITPKMMTPRDLIEEAAANRSEADAILAGFGLQILPMATHPSAKASALPARDCPRYRAIETRKGRAVRQLAVNGVHLHIGTYDDAARLAAMPILQHLVPLHIAATACSRYFEGENTGQASWRIRVLSQLAPISPLLASNHDEHRALIASLAASGGPSDLSEQWGLVRCGAGKPTIEFRAADTQPDLDRLLPLTALTAAAAFAERCGWAPSFACSPEASASLFGTNVNQVTERGAAALIVDPFDMQAKSMSDYAAAWLGYAGRALDALPYGTEALALPALLAAGDPSAEIGGLVMNNSIALGKGLTLAETQAICAWATRTSQYVPGHVTSIEPRFTA